MDKLDNFSEENEEIKKHKPFSCLYCHYTCSKKYNLDRHLTTCKTKVSNMDNKINKFSEENEENEEDENCGKFVCKCGKKYKYCSGLSKHKKKCKPITPPNDNIQIPMITPELVIAIVKENKEFHKMMMDTMLELANKVGNNNNNTTNNKTFNLQFFLNETCKNAMNIMDFVNQIVLTLDDLEETGRLGFTQGVTNMILKRLKKLDITERPIHCSDLKRETLYIKDEDIWEKEGEDKPKLTKAVKDIAYKNIKQIKTWQEKYPDYKDPESKTNDKYMNILLNAMAGSTEEEMQNNYQAIIRNIAKNSAIDK
jgi:hypothetical protein